MKKETVLDPQDIEGLKKMVADLEKVAPKNLNDAVCDIIDIGGKSVNVLLEALPDLSEEVGRVVVQKLEDFFYFHPEKGEKYVEQIKKSIKNAPKSYQAGLLSAMSDILEATDDTGDAIGCMGEEAMAVLDSDADNARISKAMEILVKADESNAIPKIIDLMINNMDGLDKFENYQLIETSLLSLKKLGGEALLRLLINPASESAIKQLRIEWRNKSKDLLDTTLASVKELDSEFAQVMLKVIDLSEFNLPFAAMLNEGLKHTDKWVRQTAVECMQKTTEGITPDSLARMLGDPAPEVRLMAVTSLGAFGKDQTGDLLLDLACRPDESMDIRLNALYSLYSQGNKAGLLQIGSKHGDNVNEVKVSLNANGLACLLMAHDEGLDKAMTMYAATSENMLTEAAYYLSELAVPEDIGAMVAFYGACDETKRDKMLRFLQSFLEKNDSPRMDEAIGNLPQEEQLALKTLIPEKTVAEKQHRHAADDHHDGHCCCSHC